MQVEEQLRQRQSQVKMDKIEYELDENGGTETSLRQYSRLRQGQTHSLMTDISQCLCSKKAEVTIRGLQALSNLLRTEYKEDVQRNTHLILPQLLKLLSNSNKCTQLMKLLLGYLVQTSFGRLSEQCLEIYKETGVKVIVSKVKQSKGVGLWCLVAQVSNLCIESRTIMDQFISEGIVDILFAVRQKRRYICSKQMSYTRLQGVVFYTLLFMHLNSPLLGRESAQRIINWYVHSMIDDYKNVKLYSKCVCPLQQLAYRIYDYKNEEQCVQLLTVLQNIMQHWQYNKNIIKNFKIIFREVFEYYHVKCDGMELPHTIARLLSGVLFENQKQLYRGIHFTIFQQYTTQMYIQFFQSIIKRSQKPKLWYLQAPIVKAFKIIKKEDGEGSIEYALRFICWVFSSYSIQKVHYSRKLNLKVIASWDYSHLNRTILKIKQSLSYLCRFRHSPNRKVAEMAETLLQIYQDIRNPFYILHK